MNPMNITIFLILFNELVFSLKLKGKNYIPIEYRPHESLTPEQISEQLGIPINTQIHNNSTLYDFKLTTNRPYRKSTINFKQFTLFPNSQYSRTRPLYSQEEDVFETTKRPHRTIPPLIFTLNPNIIDEEVETTSSIRRTKRPKSTISHIVDNEVKATKSTTRRHTKKHHKSTTTPKPFIIDNEVITQSKPTSTIQTSTQTTTQKTTTSEPSTQVTNSPFTFTTAQERFHIVDGDSGTSTQFSSTFPPFQHFTTAFGPFNPWALFTTFPPTPIQQPLTIQPGFIDFAPNCLNNAILCREGGNYEAFMRTYCSETCRLYDNAVPHETPNNCKDIADNCETLKQYCFTVHSPYYFLLKRNCQKTCKLCESSTTQKQTVDPNFPAPAQPFPSTFNPLPFIQPTPIGPSPPMIIGPPRLEPQAGSGPIIYGGECRDYGQNCNQFLGDCNKASMTTMLTRYCAATCQFCHSCEDSLGVKLVLIHYNIKSHIKF